MLNYELLTPAVERAASIAASKFPSHHDISDVKQELWAWILENKNTVARILDEENGDKVLITYLVRAAQTHLKTEDAQSYCYAEEDVFHYSLDLIKSVLEVVFTHEDWQSLSQFIGDGTPRQKSDPATSGDNLASYADISRAITELPEVQYNLLVWRYKYQKTFNYIGDQMGITKQAAQQRHEGALSAIQQALGKRDLNELRNGSEGHLRPRNRVSSQARVDHDYNGG